MWSLVDIAVVIPLTAATIAAATDLWRFRIDNALTLPLLVSGLTYHMLSIEAIGLVPSLIAACLGFVPMALLYCLGGLGAGDVKLMAGLGAWLGPVTTVHLLLNSWIVAGIFALAIIGYRLLVPTPSLAQIGGEGKAEESLASRLDGPQRRRKLLPFGVMIWLGLIVTLVGSAYFPT